MSLEEKILELSPFYIKLLAADRKRSKENTNFVTSDIFSEQEMVSFNGLLEEITEELIWRPGRLLYYEDSGKSEAAKTILKLLWPIIDGPEIFDEMTGGEYTSILVNIMGDYTDRIEMLKPTLISIPPDPELFVYYEEAMKCWLFGLNNSSIILCGSLLETVLKQKLRDLNVDLVCEVVFRNDRKYVNDFGLDKLIKNAQDQFLLFENEANNAHDIKRLRNKVVHKLRTLDSKKTFEAIGKTKVLVENLLSKKEWE